MLEVLIGTLGHEYSTKHRYRRYSDLLCTTIIVIRIIPMIGRRNQLEEYNLTTNISMP